MLTEGIEGLIPRSRKPLHSPMATPAEVVDVVVAKQELALPPTITAGQVKGFGVWALQAVMNGRGDALIDLARTNLFR